MCTKKKTWQEHRENILKHNKKIIVPSQEPKDFKNNKSKFEATCKECGHKWFIAVSKARQGRSCRKCSYTLGRRRKDWSDHVKEANEANLNVILPEARPKGTNNHSKIDLRCKICNNTWKTSLHSVKSGHGCPYCVGKASKTWEEHKQDIVKINSNIKFPNLPQKEIVRSDDYFCATCKVCNHSWNIKVSNAKSGYGCPNCSSSKGEKSIKRYLERHNIVFFQEHKFDDCISENNKHYRFDFYLPDYELLIEYHGQHHYHENTYFNEKQNNSLSKVTANDQIKLDYALSNGYRICYLPYDKIEHIDNLLDKALSSIKKLLRFDQHLLDCDR